jgi:DNA-binding CsgD family transcriptional regulator
MGSEAVLLRLVECIYEAAVDQQAWGAVLSELSAALGGPAIQLSLRIRGAEPSLLARPPTDPGPIHRIHLDERYHEIFLRLTAEEFPWASIDRRAVVERFARASEMVGPKLELDLEGSAFYREYMKPQGLACESPICHLMASVGSRPLAGMVVYRREGCRPLGASDFELLDLLVPHLRRAYRIHRRLGDARHEQRALREVLDRLPSGVILLDEDLRAVLTNRSADQILGLEDGIRLDRGRPRLDDSAQDRAFQQLLAEAIQMRAQRGRSYGKTLSVTRPSGRRSYPMMVGPLLAPPPGTSLREAVAILFIADPEGSQISTTEVLEGLYDLTPAEAELLRLLAEGRSLEEVAGQRGVTMNTARSQLKQVFAKTDTRRQGELVRLVLTGVASLGDDGGK